MEDSSTIMVIVSISKTEAVIYVTEYHFDLYLKKSFEEVLRMHKIRKAPMNKKIIKVFMYIYFLPMRGDKSRRNYCQ